jgi:peptide/nickel transport system substrate-binding protein
VVSAIPATQAAGEIAGGPCNKRLSQAKIGAFNYRCDVDARTGKLSWQLPAETPVRGGVLNVAFPALPATIDPYATSLQADWTVARNVCEPLFDVDTGYNIKPVLAESISYTNSKTAVITLRDNVVFSDGQPFTATDVVSNLKRFVLTPGNGAAFNNILSSAVATNQYTVTLNLKNPSPLVTTYLTTAYMFPASIQDNQPASRPVKNLICTGPFRVSRFIPGQRITLVRNDKYVAQTTPSSGATGRKVAWLNTVNITPIGADSTRVQALQSGSIDLATLSLDDATILANSKTVRSISADMSSSPFAIFNKRQGPMANVKIRQAFLAALNFDDVMSAGFGSPTNYRAEGTVFPKGNAWASTGGLSNYNQKSATKAKALLADAGYKNEPIVWFTTKEDPTWYGPVPTAVQQLKAAGFNIDLRVVERATIIATRSDASKWDIFSSAIPVYADPLLIPYFLDTFPGWWTDSGKNALLLQLAEAASFDARKAIWDKLQTLMYEQVPFVKFGTVSGALIGLNSKFYMPDMQYNFFYWFNVYRVKG